MNDQQAAAVRFEILGPLRALRGTEEIQLGPLQQRVILAVLLLRANVPVSPENLADAVWGTAAPTYAVNMMQKHISSLRRILDPYWTVGAPSQLLSWTAAGYLLRLPPGHLDLQVFESEVARARGLRANDDLPGAAEALHRSLDMWRGEPFAGLTSPLLDAEADRLSERRISTLEARIEIDLALGKHLDLVAELPQLIAQHPLRERLRALLMLALYRSGRQAEAFAAFQEARRQLLEELGVEPAPQLQHLHQQMLEADPSIQGPILAEPTPSKPLSTDGSGPNEPRPIPAQLPHGMPYFSGRDAALKEMHALTTPTRTAGGGVLIMAIGGTAGVGKTALAVHWAHQVRDQFPDGQLYVNLRGFDESGAKMEPAEAIRGFLDAFAVRPEQIPVSLEAQAALYRSLVSGRQVLIVLDNAADVHQVRPLLPGAPGCVVIVTSRNQMPGLVAVEGAQALSIDLLTAREARELLGRRLGESRLKAEPAAVDEIIALCARLPLALAIVAANAAAHPTFPLTVVAGELRAARGSLDAFEGDDQAADVRAVFSWSYRRLSAATARLFRMLAVHGGPDIAPPAAASLVGEPTAKVRSALTELARAHMITERTPHRYTFHDLLRVYAGELAQTIDSPADRRQAVHRVLDHALHTAYRADRLLNPHRDDVIALSEPQAGVTLGQVEDRGTALTWFTVEQPVLLATLRIAVDAGFDREAWQLAWALSPFFEFQGHWRDWADSQTSVLEAARRLADRSGQALNHRLISRAYIRVGRYQEANGHLRRALALYGDLLDSTGQAHVHRDLALLLDRKGDLSEAIEHARRALQLFEITGHRTGQARALNAVGWFSALLGDYEQALSYCRRALELQTEIGDRFGQAESWNSLGYTHHRLGEHAEGTAYYGLALDLYRQFGDRYNEADTEAYLGDAHYAAGSYDAARTAWEHALTIFDQLASTSAHHIQAKLEMLKAQQQNPPLTPRDWSGTVTTGKARRPLEA